MIKQYEGQYLQTYYTASGNLYFHRSFRYSADNPDKC